MRVNEMLPFGLGVVVSVMLDDQASMLSSDFVGGIVGSRRLTGIRPELNPHLHAVSDVRFLCLRVTEVGQRNK